MENFATYYVLLSWVYDAFHTIPYLRALGDTGCGKTRFLDVIGRLCYKATLVSGAATAAPIFRLLDRWQGTIVIDEADFGKSDTTIDIIKILNCGFESDRPVVRCDKENPKEIEFHRVFGPKVLASRETWEDKALESRCLTEVMHSAKRHVPRNINKAFYEKQAELRNKLLMYRFKSFGKVGNNSVVFPPVEPRLEQSTSAFASLVAGNPEMLKGFFEFLVAYQSELVSERSGLLEGRIVNAVYSLLVEESKDAVTSTDILEIINEGVVDEKNKVRAARVGRILRGLGLKTKLLREGRKVSRELIKDDPVLQVLYRRYISDFVTSVTDVTAIAGTAPSLYIYSHQQDGSKEGVVEVETKNDPKTPRTEAVPAYTVTTVTTVTALMLENDGDVIPRPASWIAEKLGAEESEVLGVLIKLAHDGEASQAPDGSWVVRRRA